MSTIHKDEHVRLTVDENPEDHNNHQNHELKEEHETAGILSKSELLRLEREGRLCIFGGFCLNLMFGTFFMWGTISPYIASYLYIEDKTASPVELSGVFPYMGLVMNFCLSVGVKLSRKIGVETLLFFGILSMILACVISSFLHSQPLFIAIYCILCGASNGLMFMTPLACGWEYFPQSRGFVSGLLLAGVGFGPLVFGLVCQSIVNPDNQKAEIVAYINGVKNNYFDECVANQVPKMFRVMAGVYLMLGTIAFLFIQRPKVKIARHYELLLQQQRSSADGKNFIMKIQREECKNIMQGVGSPPFWLLIFMIYCVAFYGYIVAGYFKQYGLTKIPDDAFLTIVGSVGSAFNGCSRLLWAILYDKYGFRKVFYVLCVLQLLVSASIDSVSDNKGAYFVWVCLTYGIFGGFFGIFPAVVSQIFGQELGPLIYGLILITDALANLSTFFLVKNDLEKIGWDGLIWIGFALTCLAIIFNYFMDEKYNKWGKVNKQTEKIKKEIPKIEKVEQIEKKEIEFSQKSCMPTEETTPIK